MTKTCTKILILLGALALLITGVSAAEHSYEIGTTYFSKGIEDEYYILYGQNFTLPLNITYVSGSTGEDSYLSRLEMNTTITGGDSLDAKTLSYQYNVTTSLSGTQHGSKHLEPWIYWLTTGSSPIIKDTITEAIVLNVTDLPYAVSPYTASMGILSGAGTTYSDRQTVSLGENVYVYYLYQEDNEINTNVWNMTIPLSATYNLLNGTDVPANTYEIPWKAASIKTSGTTGGGQAPSITFALNNPENIIVQKYTTEWENAVASSVSAGTTTEKIKITIGAGDPKAKDYRLLFEGRLMGDVSDVDNKISMFGAVNPADVEMLLRFYVGQTDYIPTENLIYGDIDRDGQIMIKDAELVHLYLTEGDDKTGSLTA